LIFLDTKVISETLRKTTRDTGGFAGCRLTVIDPWTAPR
jgi:hypothetical protein